jgi:hypothetical protein
LAEAVSKSMAIGAAFSTPSVVTLFGDEWNHEQGSDRIRPPTAKSEVQQQPSDGQVVQPH